MPFNNNIDNKLKSGRRAVRQKFFSFLSSSKTRRNVGKRGYLEFDKNLSVLAKNFAKLHKYKKIEKSVSVVWNSRLNTTAGRANSLSNTIELNPKIKLFGSDEVRKTFLHELAHLFARAEAGNKKIRPHGREWAQACNSLGLVDEKRCHDLPLEGKKYRRKFFYKCTNCNYELQRVRPLKKIAACAKCCKSYNGGLFDKKFVFILFPKKNKE